MVAQDLFDLLRAQPFRPFRIYAADGRVREVRHPDQAFVMRTRVILPVRAADGVPEGTEHLALAHIIRMELDDPAAEAEVVSQNGT